MPTSPPFPAGPPKAGDHLGPYLLQVPLGTGGMATVWRAVGPDGEQVALKVLNAGRHDGEEARRLRREFTALRDLRHPGIVAVRDLGQWGPWPWLAMELVDGPDLDALLKRWAQQPPPDRIGRALQILGDICLALDAIHQRGLVHRDLKPSNILMGNDGRPRLTDFGVVKDASGRQTTDLTQAGRLVGTVAFMAPEHISGEPVDARTDLYSLGAVFYLLLTGQRPLEADSIAGFLARHLREDPRPPSERNPEIPAWIDRICLRLLQKDPARRFASAREVYAALAGQPPEEVQLVGRDRELSGLVHHLHALLEEGRPALVLLQGAPGAGRTALLSALANAARARGLHPRLLQGSDPELSQHLPPLAAGPTLLLIDDLDHIDAPNLQALTARLRSLPTEPLLVTASLSDRGGRIAPFCTGLSTGVHPELHPITGLDSRSCASFLRDRGLDPRSAGALGPRLATERGGLPGPMIEQLDQLVRSGWLARDGTGELRSLREPETLRTAPLPLPERVRLRESARLAGLPLHARQLLDALVVLRLPADLYLLAALADLPQALAEEAAHALREAALLAPEDPQGQLQLDPERPRDLLYQLIDPTEREALHRAAAQALLRRTRRRPGELSGLVADHLLRGGEVAQAFPLLLDAAGRAFRAGDLDNLGQLVAQARQSLPAAEANTPPELMAPLRWRLESHEAELLERAAESEAAAQAHLRAAAAAAQAGDPANQLRSLAAAGCLLQAQGRLREARPHLELADAGLPPGEPRWAPAAAALARLSLELGDQPTARRILARLAPYAEPGASETVRAEREVTAALLLRAEGDLQSARETLESAEALLQPLRRPLPLAFALCALAELDLSRGALRLAGERAQEAARLLLSLRPARHLRAQALAMAALAETWAGDAPAGLRLTAEALPLLLNTEGGPADTWPPSPRLQDNPPQELGPRQREAAAWLARALLEQGAMAEARALLERPAPESPPGGWDTLAQYSALRARTLPDPDSALESAWGALSRAPEAEPLSAAWIALDVYLALAHQSDPSAEDALDEALDRSRRPETRILRLRALRQAHAEGGFARPLQTLREELAKEQAIPAIFRSAWT